MADRYFTREEANAVLPELRALLEQLLEIRKEVAARQPQISHALHHAPGNGGSKAASQVFVDSGRFQHLLDQVAGVGCLLKDVDQGLVDFPTIRDGREVYLCWRLGEPEVKFWHDVDAGFAGRQPL